MPFVPQQRCSVSGNFWLSIPATSATRRSAINNSLRNERERVLAMADYDNKQAGKSTKFYGSVFQRFSSVALKKTSASLTASISIPGALPGAGSSTWRSHRLFAAPRKGAGFAPLVSLYHPRHARSEKADHLLRHNGWGWQLSPSLYLFRAARRATLQWQTMRLGPRFVHGRQICRASHIAHRLNPARILHIIPTPLQLRHPAGRAEQRRQMSTRGYSPNADPVGIEIVASPALARSQRTAALQSSICAGKGAVLRKAVIDAGHGVSILHQSNSWTLLFSAPAPALRHGSKRSLAADPRPSPDDRGRA